MSAECFPQKVRITFFVIQTSKMNQNRQCLSSFRYCTNIQFKNGLLSYDKADKVAVFQLVRRSPEHGTE